METTFDNNPFARGAYNHVRSLSRSYDLRHLPVRWDRSDLAWIGLQGAWSNLQFLTHDDGQRWNGPAATADDLTAELVRLGVPASAFSRSGAHTLLTLSNVSFVYRAKHYKNDGWHLLVAPHLTGVPFSKCGHTFVHPFDPLPEFAALMLELDRSVPALRNACADALTDARKESAERALKTRAAETLVSDLFGGEIPDNVRFHVDGLRHPYDLDVVRLEIAYTAAGGWTGTRTLDIPLDFPRGLLDKTLADMILDNDSTTPGLVELFRDDECGDIPIIRYSPDGRW